MALPFAAAHQSPQSLCSDPQQDEVCRQQDTGSPHAAVLTALVFTALPYSPVTNSTAPLLNSFVLSFAGKSLLRYRPLWMLQTDVIAFSPSR